MPWEADLGSRREKDSCLEWGSLCSERGFIEVVEESFGNLTQGPFGLQVTRLITAQAKLAQREWGRRPAQKVSLPGNCPEQKYILGPGKSMHATEGHASFFFLAGLDLPHLGEFPEEEQLSQA